MRTSIKLRRRYSLSSHSKKDEIIIVPTINTKLSTDVKNHPSGAQLEAPLNKIKSTHYTPATFLPIVLLLQFKNVVVCFWSFNVIMQSIPAINTNSPLATGVPTIFIILLGMSKELYLEIQRWKEDKRINEAPCHILSDVKADGSLECL